MERIVEELAQPTPSARPKRSAARGR